MFIVLFNFAIWSSIFSIGKWALVSTTPVFFTASRMLFAGILLFTSLLVFKKKNLTLSKRQFFSLCILGFLSIYLTNIFEFYALTKLTAAKTCFLYSLSPFVAALLSYFHFKEKLTPRKIVGIVIGILAFAPIFISGGNHLFTFTLADLAMLGAVVASCWGWILLRVMVKDKGIPILAANAYSMLFGGLLALFHSFFIDTWAPIPVTNPGIFSAGLLATTFISNILCYNLYGWLLKKYTATFMSFAGLTTPFFASMVSWFFLNEPIDWKIYLCTLGVMFALWIVYREELRLGYIKKSLPATS